MEIWRDYIFQTEIQIAEPSHSSNSNEICTIDKVGCVSGEKWCNVAMDEGGRGVMMDEGDECWREVNKNFFTYILSYRLSERER